MTGSFTQGAILAAAFAFSSICTNSAKASDSLFTTYSISSGQKLNWLNCGSVSGTSGCFNSGSLGSFGHICALLSDPEVTTESGTKQTIYVIDSSSSVTSLVVAFPFTRTTTVSNGQVVTSFTAGIGSILSNLNGGTKLKCFAAANQKIIAVSTSMSTSADIIDKSTFLSTTLRGASSAATASSIDVDGEGFITINFGNGQPASSFYVLNRTGSVVEQGGGLGFVIPVGSARLP